MPKLKIDTVEHKNRFMRFTPMISMGNIATVLSIVVGGTMVYMQMQNQITKAAEGLVLVASTLQTENAARKSEIKDTIIRQDTATANLYKKLADDHQETMVDIKSSQQITHDDVKELASAVGGRFDRIEDKLDKKVDKK